MAQLLSENAKGEEEEDDDDDDCGNVGAEGGVCSDPKTKTGRATSSWWVRVSDSREHELDVVGFC
jgi:hypothetical protein